MFTIEEIKAIFQEMGLGTEDKRHKFLSMIPSETKEESQVFIRFDAWTELEDNNSYAKLG